MHPLTITNTRYGQGEGHESAVNTIIDAVMVPLPAQLTQNKSQKPKVELDNVATRFPTGTPLDSPSKIDVSDVGRVIRDISTMYLTNPNAFQFPEILHFSAQQKFTKYEMGMVFAEILGVPTDNLVKVDSIDEKAAVSRPQNCQLDVGRLVELGINVQCVDFASWWRRYLGAYRH
jgi:S-adenosylmethionine synthetase